MAALIVDDNPTNRRILMEMLGIWDMKPTAVESGATAIVEMQQAASRGEPYQLVLLGLMMPEMDGFTLQNTPGGTTNSTIQRWS